MPKYVGNDCNRPASPDYHEILAISGECGGYDRRGRRMGKLTMRIYTDTRGPQNSDEDQLVDTKIGTLSSVGTTQAPQFWSSSTLQVNKAAQNSFSNSQHRPRGSSPTQDNSETPQEMDAEDIANRYCKCRLKKHGYNYDENPMAYKSQEPLSSNDSNGFSSMESCRRNLGERHQEVFNVTNRSKSNVGRGSFCSNHVQ
ncbi:hypothetical protein BGX38DRAFT_391848 [Terfezia claveryi]|nr:hypothetical protein BGX38DRAFT_391848 [Terfezia claveryi]